MKLLFSRLSKTTLNIRRRFKVLSESAQRIPSPLACAISFLLGTFLVNQSGGSCSLKFDGMLMNPKNSIRKNLEAFDVQDDLFLYDRNKSCLLSEKIIRIWRPDPDEKPYILWKPEADDAQLLQRLLMARNVSVKPLTQTASLCNQQGRVSYGL